jgi:tRNA(Ile)-lysidine synthase
MIYCVCAIKNLCRWAPVTNGILDKIWLDRLLQYERLFLGFSGGLDSTVLLHALSMQDTLRCHIHAIHIHHGLSPSATEWAQHCQAVCERLGVAMTTYQVEIDASNNIEAKARQARHAVFYSKLSASDALLLAHHQDDQAETVLLNLMRGAGVDGLAAMQAIQPLVKGCVLRPLLHETRATLQAYAETYGLSWVNDQSNQDEQFSRNFLRHRVMPLLKVKWPAALQNMARTAAHCQQAKLNLEALAEHDSVDIASNQLDCNALNSLPRPRVVNILRVWISNNGFYLPSEANLYRLIDELILARQDANPLVTFGGVAVRRYRGHLYCYKQTTNLQENIHWSQFPSPLTLGENKGTLWVEKARQGLIVPEHSQVEVRYRQGREQLRLHGQTKSLKKLFQAWLIPPWLRETVPLIYINQKLAAVVGYAISDEFYGEDPLSCLVHIQ